MEAIRALERIARGPELESATSAMEPPGDSARNEGVPPPLSTDVQAAMNVLARRKTEQDRPGAPLDLTSTDLRRLDLQVGRQGNAAQLEGAIFYGANLQLASLIRAKLQDAKLTGATLPEAILLFADLPNADLSGANLQEAKLNWANLHGAHLHDANLQGALIGEANLEGARLSGANLRGANLHQAFYGDGTTWPEGFDPKAAGARHVDEADSGPDSVPPPD
jgi:uncharacterized protein YjbI with pentapeptide repeats